MLRKEVKIDAVKTGLASGGDRRVSTSEIPRWTILLGLMLMTFVVCAGFYAGLQATPGSTESSNGAVQQAVAEGPKLDFGQPDFGDLAPAVNRFYATAGFETVWFHGNALTMRGQELIEALADAQRYGLDPSRYGAAKLRQWSDQHKDIWINPPSAAERGQFDVALTAAGMRFARDLSFGQHNPGVYLSGESDAQIAAGAAQLFRSEILDAGDFQEGLHALQPPHAEYWRTLDALAKYRRLAQENRELPQPPEITETVGVGDSWMGVPEVALVLRATGDLSSSEYLATLEPGSTGVYTETLSVGVKRFQERHGLDADGRIGKGTIAALRVPLEQRVRQLELALERWRWLPREFSRAPVVVNIPEFRLRAMQGPNLDEAAWKTRVIVGIAKGHQTPILDDEMEYLIFGPYWNVPISITRDELVPKIRADAAYLRDHHYEVVTREGIVVTDTEVDPETLAELRDGSLLLRQKSGPGNALGGVKFVFPNPEDIFLHDTPSKNLFAQPRRDFSHGCIRVQDPDMLAEWVLRTDGQMEPDGDWTVTRVEEGMHRTSEEVVKLKRKIPVLIVYQTAHVTAEGQVRFFPDIYGRDQKLAEELSSGIEQNPPAAGI